jgi:hypothetical protein
MCPLLVRSVSVGRSDRHARVAAKRWPGQDAMSRRVWFGSMRYSRSSPRNWFAREFSEPDPWSVVLLALVGASLPLAIIYWGHWTRPFPPSARPFTATGQFDLWLFLLAAQTALWALALIPLTTSLRALWRFGRGQWYRIAASTTMLALGILVVVVVTVSRASERPYPLPSHVLKLTIIVLIGSMVALVGGMTMALVNAALRALAQTDLDTERAKRNSAQTLLMLRDCLQRMLGVEGAIIGAAVLATAGLRNAVLAYGATVGAHPLLYPHTPVPHFPPEEVLIYGAAFSALLALFWAPIYGRMTTVATRICDAFAPPVASDESWTNWEERRTSIAEYLGLTTSATANFRSTVAILTPLLSALLGLLLKT